MAQAEQRARIDAELVPLRAEAFALKAATVGVSFFPWVGLVGGLVLAINGESGAALISGAVGALSAGPQIIQATRRARGVDS